MGASICGKEVGVGVPAVGKSATSGRFRAVMEEGGGERLPVEVAGGLLGWIGLVAMVAGGRDDVVQGGRVAEPAGSCIMRAICAAWRFSAGFSARWPARSNSAAKPTASFAKSASSAGASFNLATRSAMDVEFILFIMPHLS